MAVSKEFFKIKVAVLFGYNGSKFFGSQKIADSTKPTVESELERALYAAKMISESNYNDLHKIGWCRGSRTDKGVHACVNVVSFKISLDKKFVTGDFSEDVAKADFKKKVDWTKIIGEVNSNLHKDLRVFGFRLVTRGFDVRKSARARRYEYVAPDYLFRTEKNKDQPIEELVAELNELTELFRGSRNYHNFTKKIKPHDKQAWRVLHEVRAEVFRPKFIAETGKDNFIVFRLYGQSFLYHQIRKMIGILSQIFQLGKDKDFLTKAFEKEKVDIWLAPSAGLLLDRVSLSAVL